VDTVSVFVDGSLGSNDAASKEDAKEGAANRVYGN